MGTDGPRIARRVADDLNLELYDDQKLQKIGVEQGIQIEQVKELHEREPGFFDRLFSRKPEIYLTFMNSVVFTIAQIGQGVIVGHGSQILLQDFGCAMHVFIQKKKRLGFRTLWNTRE